MVFDFYIIWVEEVVIVVGVDGEWSGEEEEEEFEVVGIGLVGGVLFFLLFKVGFIIYCFGLVG